MAVFPWVELREAYNRHDWALPIWMAHFKVIPAEREPLSACVAESNV